MTPSWAASWSVNSALVSEPVTGTVRAAPSRGHALQERRVTPACVVGLAPAWRGPRRARPAAAHGGVDGLGVLGRRVHEGREAHRVHVEGEGAVLGHDAEEVGVLAGLQRDLRPGEGQRHRAGHRRVGERGDGRVEVGVVDVGRHESQREVDRGGAGRVGVHERARGLVAVDLGAVTGLGQRDLPAGERDAGVARRLPGLLVEQRRAARSIRPSSTSTTGRDLVAAGVVAPQPARVPAARTERLRHRGDRSRR